jgi:predicted DNA-binding protein
MKAMTLRLPIEQAKELEVVARIDGIPIAEAVRTAIDAHIAARRGDRAFRARVRRLLTEERAVLERLARLAR